MDETLNDHQLFTRCHMWRYRRPDLLDEAIDFMNPIKYFLELIQILLIELNFSFAGLTTARAEKTKTIAQICEFSYNVLGGIIMKLANFATKVVREFMTINTIAFTEGCQSSNIAIITFTLLKTGFNFKSMCHAADTKSSLMDEAHPTKNNVRYSPLHNLHLP